MAAIETKELGNDIAIVMKKSHIINNSFIAKNGINAALNNMKNRDSMEYHTKNTLKSGIGLAEEKAVKYFANTSSTTCKSYTDTLKFLLTPFLMEDSHKGLLAGLNTKKLLCNRYNGTCYYKDS